MTRETPESPCFLRFRGISPPRCSWPAPRTRRRSKCIRRRFPLRNAESRSRRHADHARRHVHPVELLRGRSRRNRNAADHDPCCIGRTASHSLRRRRPEHRQRRRLALSRHRRHRVQRRLARYPAHRHVGFHDAQLSCTRHRRECDQRERWRQRLCATRVRTQRDRPRGRNGEGFYLGCNDDACAYTIHSSRTTISTI